MAKKKEEKLKLFCVLTKLEDMDPEDITATHYRCESEEDVIAELISEHYGFGDVDYAKKIADLTTGEILIEFQDEVEEEYGWSPPFEITSYEIEEVTV